MLPFQYYSSQRKTKLAALPFSLRQLISQPLILHVSRDLAADAPADPRSDWSVCFSSEQPQSDVRIIRVPGKPALIPEAAVLFGGNSKSDLQRMVQFYILALKRLTE